MQIGDLVRLLQEPDVLRNNMDIPPTSVGLVVEIPARGLAEQTDVMLSAWVQWNGQPDWDSMFIEDLEVLSEA